MTFLDPRTLLEDAWLTTLRDRASEVDTQNTFPVRDLEELVERGYLRLLVPREFGGMGATLETAVKMQQRLATAAPATALAVNMHLVVSGIVRYLEERDDSSLDWVGREIAEGEVYALGISEPNNDAVMLDSAVTATPDGEGGFTFTGTKIFTSLSPVWTRLWIFGRDDSGAEPRLVHAVLRRSDAGITIHDDWDTVGMRGTQSCTTSLAKVHVPAGRVIGSIPVGPSQAPLLAAIFANFLVLIAAVYAGIGERAADLAADAAVRRTSRQAGGAPLADDPVVRDALGRIGVRQLAVSTLVAATARRVDEVSGVGPTTFPSFMVAKYEATAAARASVTEALAIAGGSSFRAGAELGRLYRDVAASVFHPSQDASVRQALAGFLLQFAQARAAEEDATA